MVAMAALCVCHPDILIIAHMVSYSHHLSVNDMVVCGNEGNEAPLAQDCYSSLDYTNRFLYSLDRRYAGACEAAKEVFENSQTES